MDRLIAANSVPMAQADTAPISGTPQGATDGNPAANIPATRWPSYQYNAIQEELIAILTAAGITPDRNNNSQIASAIKRLGQKTVVLTDTGSANVYTAANTPPLTVSTWVDGTVQQVKVKTSNTGASTYAPDSLAAIPIYGLGLQPLQGGELSAGSIAVLMRATIPGVNSGNPICILMECAGGAQQVAPATQSQHAITAAQAAGLVGGVRNLAMSVPAASASATLTADEIIVETALGGIRYCLPNFNRTVNLATTGAGGMDTGAAPSSGYVALYAIYSPVKAAQHASDPITYPDDGRALLATNATSAIAPNVYAGANMPSGYTASALVSVWPTNASGQFVAAFQRDRQIAWLGTTVLSTTSQASTPTSLNVSAAIPLNAKFCSGYLDVSISTTSTSVVSGALHGNSLGYGGAFAYFNTGSSTAGGGQRSSFSKLLVANPQTLYYTITASAGTPGFSVYVNNYEF
ncbi:hypothetical protein [Burkholderia multivorans]|uniref:hypothetical protein n=1 Tax=Burkholderia multivorans TaxID=87883 RepID=UPI0021BE77AB|nr:hypothetical protein [Burkholderia multivorans]